MNEPYKGDNKSVAIVVPCYNEEEVLHDTANRLLQVLDRLRTAGKINLDSGVYFVDDGSRDTTWAIIRGLSTKDSRFHGIKLSRNQGHQNALLAGLFNAPGDALITIDADLQDDVSVVEAMIDEWHRGADIVYGVRSKRLTDTYFKRKTATLFYRAMRLMNVNLIYNHADFRLMSKQAVAMLEDFSEVNLFLRGIVPLLGLKTAQVFYDRQERLAGVTKYPLRKQVALALAGITSFSVTPLRLITGLGMMISLVSISLGLWAIVVKLFTHSVVPGWTSIVVPMFFLGGLQLLGLGVIGEYLAKTYMETKRRPRFFIEERTDVASQTERVFDGVAASAGVQPIQEGEAKSVR